MERVCLPLKRDLDLLRSMLLKMESLDSSYGIIRLHTFRELCDDDVVLSLHIQLLLDAGFIEVADSLYADDMVQDFLINRITFAGYDYLDTVRDESIWGEIKKRLASVGKSASLDIVKALGVAIVKQHLGI